MTLNERILDFMEGSLAPDDEAELLHRLSVSPEKRDLLRSFMNQKALFLRDRQSIVVPYEAEHALWQHLVGVMPETAPVIMESVRAVPVPFFSRIFSVASASVGAIALVIGLGAGYFAGAHQTQPANLAEIANSVSATPRGITNYGQPWLPKLRITKDNNNHGLRNAESAAADPIHNSQFVIRNSPNSPALPALFHRSLPIVNIGEPVPLADEPYNPEQTVQRGDPAIATIQGRSNGPVTLHEIGGDGGNRSLFQRNTTSPDYPKTFLERFEFSVEESFGRQFPNTLATNVSLPLITNSSIGAFFQVLPRSNVLWIGASLGTANVTRKDLFTRAGDPNDPLQTVLASDTTHAQTSYLASFIQCRVPASAATDVTFTAGYGWANLGQMIMGELGLHYNISREVGIQFGLRVLRFSYDLTAEKAAAIRSGTGSLVVPNGVADASPSYNTELNTGLYFHF